MHIKAMAFCGIRRLNAFASWDEHRLLAWRAQRTWYDFKDINIVIGVNGGGKTTLLDMVRMLAQPAILATLPRENLEAKGLTAFEFAFADGASLIGQARSHPADDMPSAANVSTTNHEALNAQWLNLLCRYQDGTRCSFNRNVSKLRLDDISEQELTAQFARFGCQVCSWPSAAIQEESAMIEALNQAALHLPGVWSENEQLDEFFHISGQASEGLLAKPFYQHDNGRLGVLLSDDSRQSNHIHWSTLPSGWRQIADLFAWLGAVPAGAICLIEEPEVHLHPRLQRYLVKEVERITVERGLQLFIATHSPVFQQRNAWQADVSLFEANAQRLLNWQSAGRVLDALGIRGADISQSNGIIWIEGPSDRIYIKHWLTLYCETHGLVQYQEHVDYAFALYGGALLSHASLCDTGDFIELLSINRKLMIVMDRDDDFTTDAAGDLLCVSPRSAKKRILDELLAAHGNTECAWVTDAYTMESYLPLTIRDGYFKLHKNRLRHLRGEKVAIAGRYVREHLAWAGCTSMPDQLAVRMAVLHRMIQSWTL
ncbi:AAA family ATPase [Duganella sp. CY15W]|uniref:ATP-dependent nuclease n=1 Tax=Duganella sp. CY15W TaxID=2692172 RepID=UPI00136F931D|nr:AAA family ATPase [Duganella sp. CY15W]MYM31169.1 AAA family ATPase [Duganella sp. CY15W]